MTQHELSEFCQTFSVSVHGSAENDSIDVEPSGQVSVGATGFVGDDGSLPPTSNADEVASRVETFRVNLEGVEVEVAAETLEPLLRIGKLLAPSIKRPILFFDDGKLIPQRKLGQHMQGGIQPRTLQLPGGGSLRIFTGNCSHCGGTFIGLP